MITRLAAAALLWAGTTRTALAVFVVAPEPLPEPATPALFAAAVLAFGGLRYLRRRRNRKGK